MNESNLKVIAGGRVIDPQANLDCKADVYIENGKVKKIETGSLLAKKDVKKYKAGECIWVEGFMVTPGLIDIHVHLREPGREDEETVVTGAEAAAAGGFTAICCMPNTSPPIDNQETVQFILDRAANAPVKVFPIAAVTKERKGEQLSEVGDLVNAGAVAISDDGSPVSSAVVMKRALDYARMFDIAVISHAEDNSLSGGTHMNEGYTSTTLGIKGNPSISEEICITRDMLLADYTKSRLHIAHVSTRGSVELLREGKRRNIAVTAEVTPHHFTLTDDLIAERFDTNLKMNPPLRTKADVEGVIAGLQDGTIDCIATDHAPHSIEEKDVEFDLAPNGIIGLETALGLAVTHLVKPGLLSWSDLIEKMSANPAKIMKLEMGTLKKGYPADITVIDPERSWQVNVKKFKSKSRNSPYHGRRLTGRAIMTIVDGKVVYQTV
ncbi:MAG: dihydroorotase [candidate division Zixibacteria bacterium]|nr:dihydroorotase [candidate division Zixibacteria bacterium]MBU1469463.1 dihydroorotase [candidate division Zixibacteria bacterium]MBU2624217.1 dihydroorotase [candidate division Zixibacteria bacterium]